MESCSSSVNVFWNYQWRTGPWFHQKSMVVTERRRHKCIVIIFNFPDVISTLFQYLVTYPIFMYPQIIFKIVIFSLFVWESPDNLSQTKNSHDYCKRTLNLGGVQLKFNEIWTNTVVSFNWDLSWLGQFNIWDRSKSPIFVPLSVIKIYMSPIRYFES